MISIKNYSAKEMDLLYSSVERAIENKTSIDMFAVAGIIKPEDFFLKGAGPNGLLFEFNGLKWVENGEIYNCPIQPQTIGGEVFPEWYPVITYNDRNYMSSGDLQMIKKKNRYNQMIEHGWETTQK